MNRNTIVRQSWAIILSLICFSFINPATTLKIINIQGYPQGATYQQTYYTADSVFTHKETDKVLTHLDTSVSLYLPTSSICKFNRSVRGIYIDLTFQTLVKNALKINKETYGLIDITLKPLVDTLGFGVKRTGSFPDSKKMKALLNYLGSARVWLEGSFLHILRPGVQFDLIGIAQGYAADLLARLLEKHHIYNYVTEQGAELRIKGNKPNGDPFNIGIEAIDGNDISPLLLRKIIAPGDGAVTTLGNYCKF